MAAHEESTPPTTAIVQKIEEHIAAALEAAVLHGRGSRAVTLGWHERLEMRMKRSGVVKRLFHQNAPDSPKSLASVV